MLSDKLATIAMEPGRRKQLLARTHSILNRNLPRLEEWIHGHGEIFSFIRPVAGAITTVRYSLPISPRSLFNRLRLERSVLLTVGPHHGLGRYIRIGYGYDLDRTLEGLAIVSEFIKKLQKAPARKAKATRVVASRHTTVRAQA